MKENYPKELPMRENKKMQSAKDAKNDEFYTQYSDIQKELNAYLEYDADASYEKDRVP